MHILAQIPQIPWQLPAWPQITTTDVVLAALAGAIVPFTILWLISSAAFLDRDGKKGNAGVASATRWYFTSVLTLILIGLIGRWNVLVKPSQELDQGWTWQLKWLGAAITALVAGEILRLAYEKLQSRWKKNDIAEFISGALVLAAWILAMVSTFAYTRFFYTCAAGVMQATADAPVWHLPTWAYAIFTVASVVLYVKFVAVVIVDCFLEAVGIRPAPKSYTT